MKTSIYIHIPFCISKCKYCDFASYPSKIKYQNEYFNALKNEIRIFKSNETREMEIETIYIGGGTPSLVDSKYIVEVLEYIKSNFNCENTKEISIEMNPNTVTKEKILAYKKIGINRFSLGLQTTNDELLSSIGRVHTYSDFLNAIEIMKKENIDNINVDLIYNLPNQKIKDVLLDIEKIANLKVNHISFYSLTLMEGTIFYKEYKEGKLILPDEDTERDMYHEGILQLEKFGYNQYEISNFSLKNSECLHNIVYWKTLPYIGFGLGAHSYFDGKRFGNQVLFDSYLEKADENTKPIDSLTIEIIEEKEAVFEYLMLGLRMNKGIKLNEFEKRFDKKISEEYKIIFQKLSHEGLITIEVDGYKLTLKGIDLSNYVFEKLML